MAGCEMGVIGVLGVRDCVSESRFSRSKSAFTLSRTGSSRWNCNSQQSLETGRLSPRM